MQLERRGQFVDPLLEQFHHIIVAPIEHNFAGPHRVPRVDLHTWVGCDDPWRSHISETFPHALQNAPSVVGPLIVIIAPDKIGRGCPVFVFDRVEKVCGVKPDLPLGPPEPAEIQPDAKRQS